MWLQVVAVDDQGKETELGTRVFGTELKDKDGNYPVELWDAVAFATDDRIRRWSPSPRPTPSPFLRAWRRPTSRPVCSTSRSPTSWRQTAGVENPTTTMAEAVKRSSQPRRPRPPTRTTGALRRSRDELSGQRPERVGDAAVDRVGGGACYSSAAGTVAYFAVKKRA